MIMAVLLNSVSPVPAFDDPNAETGTRGNPDRNAAKKTNPAEVERGRVLKRTYSFDAAGKEMEYAVYVPKSYDGTRDFPLIVALHGLHSNPRQILGYPGFVSRAEKHGYLLAAPMGYNTRGWYGSLGKGGWRRGDPKNLGELSEQDVMNVLKIVRSQFHVDSERIYLYGHSMGGGGAMHLAMTYPNIWAAIAVVAPAAYKSLDELTKARHIPAMVVQGDRDPLVPVRQVRRWVEKMKELEMDHEYIEVKDGGHVLVAFQKFDDVFRFFADRTRPSSEEDKAAAKP